MESQTHSKGGRPSSYKPEYSEDLIKYFKGFTDEPFTKEVVKKTTKYYADNRGVKETYEEFKFIAKRLPTLFGFAQKIGVRYQTVWNWANKRVGKMPDNKERDTRPFQYPEFFDAYKTARHFQTEYLTAIGLGGMAPSAFAIFTAKNTIGWRDKNEIGFTDDKGRPVAGGFVVLPRRLTEAEAEKEFKDQEGEGADDTG